MIERTYVCAICQERFASSRRLSEALDECHDWFGLINPDAVKPVCQDCWDLLNLELQAAAESPAA